MSTSPVLALPFAGEPLVLSAAKDLAAHLATGEPVTKAACNAALTAHFGGSDAQGLWSVRDAHAAIELAQVVWLRDCTGLSVSTDPGEAGKCFDRLEALRPRQSFRSEEQIELQQFATPPRLAWLAARSCALVRGERVLEPSAGTGMLAVWTDRAGCSLVLNEISAARRDSLVSVFPAARVTNHDGELIDELLDPALRPSVVLMNPPYSHGLERGHDGRTGARHLRSAWNRLAPGGRLVAIVPEWFDLVRFIRSVGDPIARRLDVTIERAFVAHGTSITTRLLVIDKTKGDCDGIIVSTAAFDEICAAVDALPARFCQLAAPVVALRPVRPLPLLRPAARPLPSSIKPTATAQAVRPLSFKALDGAAPTPEQVGHYLPYRPSRIVIPGAGEHPTPLVESVAMGSITAPVPTAVPQLPGGVIERGLLSAAQAETLIYAANAHARDLPGLFEPEDKGCSLKPSAEGQAYRAGYFLGDGTGAGKGRQVASVILDRWVRGERRHIWISKNEALLEDARRDWSALGGLPIDVQPLASWKLGLSIAMPEGILFVTYPTLRSGRADATRLDQILAWAGDDFDGVIVFDEAHAMANAAGGEGSRGKVKGSEQGIAGVRLQNLLPRIEQGHLRGQLGVFGSHALLKQVVHIVSVCFQAGHMTFSHLKPAGCTQHVHIRFGNA